MWSFVFLYTSDTPYDFDQLKDTLPNNIQSYFIKNYLRG